MVQPGGKNRGSITEAMNSTVTRGTPRTSSMNETHSDLTTGMVERRPSASTMPIGNEATMPTIEISRVRNSPPQRLVSTRGCSGPPPANSQAATNG